MKDILKRAQIWKASYPRKAQQEPETTTRALTYNIVPIIKNCTKILSKSLKDRQLDKMHFDFLLGFRNIQECPTKIPAFSSFQICHKAAENFQSIFPIEPIISIKYRGDQGKRLQRAPQTPSQA